MKYFTKEFIALECLSHANHAVKVSKRAERKDEKFYREVYEKRYTFHVQQDEILAQQFPDYVKEQIELYSRLPQEILEKVADIRVLALGYASAEVKKLLTPYCTKLRRTVRRIRDAAYTETDEAEDCLQHRLDLNEYDDYLIFKLEERDGDILLRGNYCTFFRFKEGEIIEGKGRRIWRYSENDPYQSSRVIAAELHRTDGKFETHFLIYDCDENYKDDMWYLTIRSSDVLLLRQRGNSVVPVIPFSEQ